MPDELVQPTTDLIKALAISKYVVPVDDIQF